MARKAKTTRTTEASANVAEPELPVLDTAPAPARRGRPRKTAQAAPPTQEDSSAAAMDVADHDAVSGSAMPADSDGAGQTTAESPAANHAAAAPDATAASKSAAQWDQSTETAHFDWPEIERTASQQGPNQVMAKLLIAARAEGANSRWPF